MFNYFPRRTSRQEDYTHLKSFSEDEMPFRYALVHDVQQFCAEIPMRLSLEERSVMRLIQGIFNASRYTDRIDTPASSHNPENQKDSTAIAKHRALQLKEIFSVCLALLSGIDRTYTTILLSDVRSLKKMEGELQRLFEYIRRYKIVNPDLLRTDYGKVLYLLQDSVQEPIRQELGFCLVGTIRTVGSFCEEHGLKELLNDPLLPLCTTPVPFHSNRVTLNNALRFKSAAIRRIVQKYRGVSGCSCDDIETVVYSIADANQYAQDNAGSVQHFLDVIREYFSPDPPQRSEFDLGITAGTHGSRLTHNHKEQFHFVQQTLTLWRNILRQMFALWTLAEREFLDCSCPYSFRNTGQGYHRVQHKATATRQAIERIIESTRREVGTWVGSHRVHLGDDQVPNGFYFLDKYAQVSRIINPILLVFKHIDTMCDDRNRSEKDFMERTWKSADRLKRVILTDFLRFGFDGSGGDNMDDAGSCIDGRLTSAWNWCSEIHLKPFYPFFVLAGVNSFDGDLHT